MSEHLDRLAGLKLVGESCGICEYIISDAPPEALAEQILAGLPENRQLSFHDPDYPSPSDAGAYVSIRRKGTGFVYHFGNHGWSRDWQPQSFEFLTAYLARCLPVHHPLRSRERLRLTPFHGG